MTTIEQDPAWLGMYGDMRNDQQTMGALSWLVFGAAVFAAFNLTSRMVEAKRRELGIGMALGQPRWQIALRPVLMGLEIGVLGVFFGIGAGLLVAAGFRSVMVSLQPMPVFLTPAPGERIRARRGDRPSPAGRRDALARLARGACEPGRRDPYGSPRRQRRDGAALAATAHLARLEHEPHAVPQRAPGAAEDFLTAMGIGVSVMALVGVLGALDSYFATIDRGAVESNGHDAAHAGRPGRGRCPHRMASPQRSRRFPACRLWRRRCDLGARSFDQQQTRIDVQLELLDLQNEVWNPTITDAVDPGGLPGIVLAEKAASDLGLVPGDVVTVRHPVRLSGETAFGSVDEPMRVIGLHPYPIRAFAYLDDTTAARFRLAGMANTVQLGLAPGADPGAVERAVFELPGMASAQPADATVSILEDLMASFTGIFRIVELFVLGLALLIAFNAAAISVDERSREHATMFAFGVTPPSVLEFRPWRD